MKSFQIILQTLEDTEKLGRLLGANCQPGHVFCLDGDLGAGKTTLTQGIAKGLDLSEDLYVSSPSFAVMHEYPGKIPLYHMDFYRLHGSDDVLALGFDEYFYKNGLTVIEWPTRAEEILPEDTLSITIELSTDGKRHFTFKGDALYQELLVQIVDMFPAAE